METTLQNALDASCEFILVRPDNPTLCPSCGQFVAAIWEHHDPAKSYFRAIACERCAGSDRKDAR